MKITIKLFVGMAIFLFIFSCENNLPASEIEATGTEIEFTGTIKQIKASYYQYGSYSISNEGTFYALKCDRVDLNNYLNQEVTILAKKIEGYPLEGGPIYLRVLEVKD